LEQSLGAFLCPTRVTKETTIRKPRNKTPGIKADIHSTNETIRICRAADHAIADSWASIDRTDIFLNHFAEADQCRETIRNLPPDDLDRIAAEARLKFITSVSYSWYLEFRVWLKHMGRRHGNEIGYAFMVPFRIGLIVICNLLAFFLFIFLVTSLF
jgi:hypothetical protein